MDLLRRTAHTRTRTVTHVLRPVAALTCAVLTGTNLITTSSVTQHCHRAFPPPSLCPWCSIVVWSETIDTLNLTAPHTHIRPSNHTLSTINRATDELIRLMNINPLTPNDHYSGRTEPQTSKRCILYIYSTNIGTEYFKHGVYCPFLSLQSAVCFIILTYLVPVLFTFNIQSVLNISFYIFIQQI